MPTVKEVIEHRLNGYKPNEHIAVAIWGEEDVIGRAEERGITITQKEAQEILDSVDHKQDCSIGISWDVLDVYIDELVNSPYR